MHAHQTRRAMLVLLVHRATSPLHRATSPHYDYVSFLCQGFLQLVVLPAPEHPDSPTVT